jgi:hypothetical protein
MTTTEEDPTQSKTDAVRDAYKTLSESEIGETATPQELLAMVMVIG